MLFPSPRTAHRPPAAATAEQHSVAEEVDHYNSHSNSHSHSNPNSNLYVNDEMKTVVRGGAGWG